LVIVQTGANASAAASGISPGRETDAFSRGVTRSHDKK
jgi:hypothetical protein